MKKFAIMLFEKFDDMLDRIFGWVQDTFILKAREGDEVRVVNTNVAGWYHHMTGEVDMVNRSRRLYRVKLRDNKNFGYCVWFTESEFVRIKRR